MWQWEVEKALGLKQQRPVFFDRLTVARLVFSTPAVAKPFDDLSLGARHSALPFHAHSVGASAGRVAAGVRTRCVAPYEKNPECWASLSWVNLYSHEPLAREAGTLGLGTIGQYIFDWEARARVSKMVTAEGKRVTSETRGLLVPMRVVAERASCRPGARPLIPSRSRPRK